MFNILSGSSFNVKVGRALYFTYQSFAYPPFYDYSIVSSLPDKQSVKQEEIIVHQPPPGICGGRMTRKKIFTFNNPGNYVFSIKSNDTNEINNINVTVTED